MTKLRDLYSPHSSQDRTRRKNPLDGLRDYTGGWDPANKDYWAVSNTNVLIYFETSQNKNPLDGLRDYTGGWDPANKDYWTSVVWSVVYAPLLGLLWVILGLGIVGFSLLTCLCCRDKWSEMRDPAYAKYTKKDLWVPLGFMLLGIVAVLVGFSVMVAGGAQLHNRVNTVTQYVTETVDFTASVVYNLSSIMETSSSITVANAVIPADKKADIESKVRQANQTATELQAKTADGINLVNNGLRVLSTTFYVIGCVITFLCILALLFSLLKWVVASNVIITITWVVVFFTWCMTAGLLIAYLVNGDTNVALEQVQQSPTMNSAMDKYLHCIPSEKLLNATRYARYTAATALTTANSSVVSNAPRIFAFLGVPGGICVPYGPAPNFTRDTDLCVKGTILFPQFVNVSGVRGDFVNVSGTCADFTRSMSLCVQGTILFPQFVNVSGACADVACVLMWRVLAITANNTALFEVDFENSQNQPPTPLQVLAITANNTALFEVDFENSQNQPPTPLQVLAITANNTALVPEVVSNSLTSLTLTAPLLAGGGEGHNSPLSSQPHFFLLSSPLSPSLPFPHPADAYDDSRQLCFRAGDDAYDDSRQHCVGAGGGTERPHSHGSPPSSCPPSHRLPPPSFQMLMTTAGNTALVPDVMLMTTAGSSALVPDVVKNDLTATAQTLALLESTIPNVLTLVDCSYVANIAKFAISEGQAMVTNFQMLWVGFLVITIACMMQALSTPIYVFRAVRLGDRLNDAEAEGLYKASAVPVAYPAGGEGGGLTQVNEPSFAEGSDNSYAGESGAGYK
ncbi:unnamed protein product [Closterium sp. Naga37s-1]|nr:unnamed protein product [Closterium sp. Naga37s-1]